MLFKFKSNPQIKKDDKYGGPVVFEGGKKDMNKKGFVILKNLI